MAYLPEFKTDIFISYARVDNNTVDPREDGWVARFVKHLEIELNKGKKDFSIRLWRATKDADVAKQRNK
ncbi:MAG: hypothetical protein ACKVZH_16295 [Blastocatellia bacterium]